MIRFAMMTQRFSKGYKKFNYEDGLNFMSLLNDEEVMVWMWGYIGD